MMQKLIAQIEKGKPFFEKLSRNIYLRAIRDGFISAMPVILFSSIFLLIAYVPNIFGFKWDKGMEAILMKPYNYTMGLVAFLVAGTTAKSLTDSFNRKLESTNQINFISTMLAAMCGFLFLASDPAKDGGFLSAFMGTKGLLTAFLSAFVTVIVYNFCVKRNITIKMPKEVPPNISQVFKDLIPFSAVIIILYALDLVIRNSFKSNVAEGILKLFEPLFTAAAGGYGAHMDIMKEYQLIILAPQVASNYEDIKQDTDRLGIKLAKTQGAEYIKLTRDGQAALDFVQKQFEN
ncbi:TPA: PTS transporter subunit EIIC [Staphylococcus aureus]